MNWTLDRAQFTALVADARHAPSVHNSQPWRFRFTGSAIEIHLDPDRVLSVTDPTGRNARVSCGAAAYGMALALAARGMPAVITIVAAGTLLATLTPDVPRPATGRETRLYRALGQRHSNRHPFLDTRVPNRVRVALLEAARAEGGWLELIDDVSTVAEIAELTRAADRVLTEDAEYQAELEAWTRAGGPSVDGVRSAVGGPAPHSTELLVRRQFGGAGRPREFESLPLIGALGVHGRQAPDDVRAGMVLHRVLLTATDHGLASSMFTQPLDVAATRDLLPTVLGRHDGPHVLLRLGYAARLFPTPRRPITDLID